MADTKKPNEKQPGEKKPGKFHYNPVNMSGKEAGIFEEHDERKNADKTEQPPKPGSEKPAAKGR